ncbi:MAG TPA: TetR/AcrR family transcriptional regulator [Bryobacteraceae bacterium]|jgi:AcrR family transcriptional regulator|nr:TetR/AcrR family transcriptional regulator [Bryobacteraceae bacterium]
MPVQERSIDTVQSIHEATIQVLLQVGSEKLTTVRVAERAGVSVGTMYQYYPNKQALLYTVLEEHLTALMEEVERACRGSAGAEVAAMVENVVSAFIQAKLRVRQKSLVLYEVSPQFRQDGLMKRIAKRGRQAIAAMLRSTKAIPPEEVEFASLMFYSTLTGTVATVLAKGAPASMLEAARRHLIVMLTAYLTALSTES